MRVSCCRCRSLLREGTNEQGFEGVCPRGCPRPYPADREKFSGLSAGETRAKREELKVGEISRMREAEAAGLELGLRGVAKLSKEHYEAMHGRLLGRTGDDGRTRAGKTAAIVRTAFERGHHAGLDKLRLSPEEAAAELRKLGPADDLCWRCEESVAEVRLSATDLEGVVLDYEKVCRGCAKDAGFEVGKGG